MDWKTFFSNIIGDLAWPSVVMILLVLIRRQLGGLAERVEEIALPGGARAKFVKALAVGRAESEAVAAETLPPTEQFVQPSKRILELANEFPEAAVIDAYSGLEQTLLEARERFNLPPRSNLPAIVRQLIQRGYADAEIEVLFNSVRQARNVAAHGREASRITPGEAAEYIQQVSYLQSYFRTVLQKLPSSPVAGPHP